MKMTYLFTLIICLLFPAGSAFCAQTKSTAKYKDKVAYSTISEGTNFWQYFTKKDKIDAYKYDSVTGQPIFPDKTRKTAKDKKLYQAQLKKELLRRKTRTTGLSENFASTEHDPIAQKITQKDINDSIARMKKAKKSKTAKPSPNKQGERKYISAGSYYEEEGAAEPGVQEYKDEQRDFKIN